jgi:ABC-type uncharacterized transport system permease subunit
MHNEIGKLARRLILMALVLTLVLLPIVASLDQPRDAVALFLMGPLQDRRHFGNVLEAMTPMLFTGLAVSLMFRAGMFNLGAEGAFFLGGVLATYVVLHVPLPPMLLAATAIMVGGVVGASACAVPAWLKVQFGASELVCSLMLNYAALFLGLYIVNYYLRDPNAGAMMSYRLPVEARLPRILPGTRLHLGFLLGLAACVAGNVFLFRTRWGYEARLVGSNAAFARHVGIGTTAVALLIQCLGGFIAAAGGAIEVQGMYTRFTWTDLPGLGWNGLVVAILAGNNPLLVPLGAFFLAYLSVGGDLLAQNFAVPAEVVGLIKALVILLSTASITLRRVPLRQTVSRHTRQLGLLIRSFGK